MIDLDFTFEAEIWEYQGKGSWHFVTLPVEMSDDIKVFTKHLARGFRSVRVKVTIGESVWLTSLFPSKEAGAYVLPIKAAVRKAEGLAKGDVTTIKISVAT
ncbi:DUF1905 domain-containing protein [Litorimonas sp. RW-G-Af-16]|uniref:DUF1905 domain-containing protein n=1 Tax=Litorimonas sp. RW-G-Af-16 TaxID=3241168 RepID=UPI003AAAD2B5